MKKYPILFCFLLSLIGSHSYANFEKYQWDRPEFTQKQNLGPSEYFEDKTKLVDQICQVYKKFTLFIKSDPALKGQSYRVRAHQKSEFTKQACTIKPSEKLVEFFSGELVGAIGSTLFFLDEGMLGDTSTIVTINALTGKILLSALFEGNIQVRNVGNKVQMTYFAFLKEPVEDCDLKKDTQGICYQRILKFNGVPDDLKIQKPNCDKNFESPGLFLETLVSDVQTPKPKFIGKTLKCAERQ
jgi:hypothetical protein